MRRTCEIVDRGSLIARVEDLGVRDSWWVATTVERRELSRRAVWEATRQETGRWSQEVASDETASKTVIQVRW